MVPIKIGVIGVGNCASSLIQGITYYRRKKPDAAVGILNWSINGYTPGDIQVVSAFDIDGRKVGKDVHRAIFEPPNCTKRFVSRIPKAGVEVSMGRIMDGFAEHMKDYDLDDTFLLSDKKEPTKKDIVRILKNTDTEVLLNYLPVGSEAASRFYAECALTAGVSFINNIPVFIASDPIWAEKFKAKNIPLIGDDIKSQIGATIVHRTLANLFEKRGVKVERTYQMNTGGNTDFLNMLDRQRLSNKKKSKTAAVQSVLSKQLEDRNIHIGPSDYIPWLNDNKICFIRMEGRIFGNLPMNVDLKLSVEDSPNSAGVTIDCIRICKLAMDRNIGGVLEAPSAYYCKYPPVQYNDDQAFSLLNDFISNES
jgi:myo-inositol-1-phosphate synthase